jgi:hypothetical protein
VLIDLGIAYGQGFHLARPGSLEDLNVLLGVPEVDRRISLSAGTALIPDHAVDAQSPERAADRAPYGDAHRVRQFHLARRNLAAS